MCSSGAKSYHLSGRTGQICALVQDIRDATGWQAHGVRGVIRTLAKKTGTEITSTGRESDKARVYEVKKTGLEGTEPL